MANLVLVRGAFRSGKTERAKEYASNGYIHVEKSMWFDGNYQNAADAMVSESANDWVRSTAFKHLRDGHNVVVSDDLCTVYSVVKYVNFANMYGHNVIVIRMGKTYIAGMEKHEVDMFNKQIEDVSMEIVVS